MQPLMPKHAHAALPCAVRVLRLARAQEALLEVEVLAAHHQRVDQNCKIVWRGVEHRRKRLLEVLAHPSRACISALARATHSCLPRGIRLG